jgi:hypothetical protein
VQTSKTPASAQAMEVRDMEKHVLMFNTEPGTLLNLLDVDKLDGQ